MLFLYNTLTKCKEEFKPLKAGQVSMYVCGPTVYNYFHIGNARPFIVFDTLRRVLERKGLKVTYVQNITDIDDKIIQRAQQESRESKAVAQEFTQAFFEDLASLGCQAADYTPKATEHISEIISLVQELVNKDKAYVKDGTVFFSVEKFSDYGKISGKKTDELLQGARIEINQDKTNPLDFVLWKQAKPGEPAWESPWGLGRPGWHIECSAMSMKYLGTSFDIHGGGEDLIFPHHENENAQSQSLTGKPLAQYWLHNGYLKIAGEKMSKSLGNFKLVRDILKTIPYQVLRLFMLSAHYRSPLDFNPANIDAAYKGYEEFRKTLERLQGILDKENNIKFEEQVLEEANITLISDKLNKFNQALEDDLNTAAAIGHLFSLTNIVKQVIAGRNIKLTRDKWQALALAHKTLLDMSGVLGITPTQQIIAAEVKHMVELREQARQDKDWEAADKLRSDINKAGFQVEDTSLGPLILLKQD